MTFGTYLSIVELAKAKSISNATNTTQAEALATATAKLAKIAAECNIDDDLIVSDINIALTNLNALTN